MLIPGFAGLRIGWGPGALEPFSCSPSLSDPKRCSPTFVAYKTWVLACSVFHREEALLSPLNMWGGVPPVGGGGEWEWAVVWPVCVHTRVGWWRRSRLELWGWSAPEAERALLSDGWWCSSPCLHSLMPALMSNFKPGLNLPGTSQLFAAASGLLCRDLGFGKLVPGCPVPVPALGWIMPGGCHGCLQTLLPGWTPRTLWVGLPGLWLVLVVDFCLLGSGKVGFCAASPRGARVHWPLSLPVWERRGSGQKLLKPPRWCSLSVQISGAVQGWMESWDRSRPP